MTDTINGIIKEKECKENWKNGNIEKTILR